MGVLIYELDYSIEDVVNVFDLDELVKQICEVFDGEVQDVLKEFLFLNGFLVGVCLKVLIGLDVVCQQIVYGVVDLLEGFEYWLVKFLNMQDGLDVGVIEYVYVFMVCEVGIDMLDVYLFLVGNVVGYFVIRWFDWNGSKCLYMYIVGGLLYLDFCVFVLDYEDLLIFIGYLMCDVCEVEKMFCFVVFNVFVYNCDDYVKNFLFLMDEIGWWKFLLVYDLMFLSGFCNE